MPNAMDDLFDKTDMALLSQGGHDALVCFMKLSRRVLDEAGDDGLRSFVAQVLPLLPEHDRNEIVVLLFSTLIGSHGMTTKKKSTPSPSAMLH
jgi:hypothetical protein